MGQGKSTRIEQRTGSADANPYFLIAASIASGLYGLEHELAAPELIEGNGYYNKSLEKMPRSLSEAAAFLKKSQKAMEYFGSDFVYILSELINFDVAMYHKTGLFRLSCEIMEKGVK